MFKLNFACRCTYFTSSSLQILLGCYELNFACIRQTYNINISSYTKTRQIMQYYYAMNRSRRCPPRAVIVTPHTFRPCSLHAPRINTSHSTLQFTTSHFRTFALHSLHTPDTEVYTLHGNNVLPQLSEVVPLAVSYISVADRGCSHQYPELLLTSKNFCRCQEYFWAE